MQTRTIKCLIIPLILLTGCSAYIGRDLPVARSIWDDCFVGRFEDPGNATLFVSHFRSMVTIQGEKDPSSAVPWETFTYMGDVHVPDIKGQLTLFFPEVCDPECRIPTVDPIDGRTGESEIAANFVISGGSADGCTPSTSDVMEFSFTYTWDGAVYSETIAAQRE